MKGYWAVPVMASILFLGTLGFSQVTFAEHNPNHNPDPNAGGVDAINTQIDDLQAQITENDNDIFSLQGLIDAINTALADIISSITNLQNDLAAETAAREAADSILQDNIDTISLTPGPQGPAGSGVGLSCENQNAIAAVAPGFTKSPDCKGLDIVTANSNSNNVSVLLGDGSGTTFAKTDFAVGSFPRGVAVGDFNP